MNRLLRSMLLWLLVLPVYALGIPSATWAQDDQAIKIAILPSDSISLAYYAVERGSFKKAGLEAELYPLQSGPAIAAAVASNAAQFGAANIIALAVAHEKGIRFTAIAPAGVYTGRAPTVALVVAKSSKIVSAKDLNGRIVAVDSLKTLGSIGTSAWVDRNGGDSKSLKFIELPFAEMGQALAAGRVDAAFLPEPLLSKVTSTDGRVLAAPLDAISPELLLGAWFTSADYAAAHPDVVRRFREVMIENAKWAGANKDAAAAIYEKYSKVTLTARANRMGQSGTLDIGKVQPLIDAAAKYGALTVTVPASDLFNPIALNK
jgi:NitT/TauT family transport system substrate-binding protein